MSVSKTRLLVMTDLIPVGRDNAVSARELRDDLATLPGFDLDEVHVRTIQRDLKTLHKVTFKNKRLVRDNTPVGMTVRWYWERTS